jgi:hypothetical protein
MWRAHITDATESQPRKGNLMTKTLKKADLSHFTGSEQWYRHGINRNVLLGRGEACCRRRRRLLAFGRNRADADQ